MVNDDEREVLAAILLKGVKAHDAVDEARRRMDEALKFVHEADEQLERFRSAMLLFGHDMKEKDAFDVLARRIGTNRYNQIIRQARGLPEPTEEKPDPTLAGGQPQTSDKASSQPQTSVAAASETQTSDEAVSETEGSRTRAEDDQGGGSGKDGDQGEDRSPSSTAGAANQEGGERSSATIRQLVTQVLKAAPFRTATSADIRQAIEDQGVKMHEKTVGMTLYRMSKEGLVGRVGFKWHLKSLGDQHDVFS